MVWYSQENFRVIFEVSPQFIQEVIQINVTATRWENCCFSLHIQFTDVCLEMVLCCICALESYKCCYFIFFYFPQWQWRVGVYPPWQLGANLHSCEVRSRTHILSVSGWTPNLSRRPFWPAVRVKAQVFLLRLMIAPRYSCNWNAVTMNM